MFGLTFSIVPVALMVMGVIYFVNLVSNRDLKKRRQYRFEFARALRQKAGQESDPDKKAGYLLSADYLENQGFSSIASQSIVPTGVKVSSAQSTETPEMVVSPLSSEETIVENKIDTLESSKSVRAQLVSLDNINILFYIGAFLVVVAAGVFVGFNYESISGIGKTMFLAIFALVFYGVGTYLYLKAKNIQQAGLVFVTVGLILAPLVGLAYFKFSAMGTDGHMIWFVTSLIVTALYVVSLLIVKKPFLSYFVTFVSLSLLESSISVFDAPTQYFAWGMAVFSTIFLLVGQIKFRDEYVSSAFRVSANIFLPISIIFSLVFSAFTLESSLLINGTNLIFAAVFYNLSSFLSLQTKHRQGFLAASLLLFPVGIILLLCDKLVAETTIAIVTGGIALIYFVAYELLKKIFDDKRPLLLVFFAGVIPLLSVSLIFDN
ncbi:MAG: hypothetical protein NTW50_02370, partial [Candidatus Berkelbacteria bacterium]|nr:hypothetical protein [Candidatus Berkelbacteria bacterium]